MAGGTVAPLKNVSLCMQALETATKRAAHLPGMVCLYGPSGWGKSTAAAYAANSTEAYYVEAKSSWTRKALLLAITNEMGVPPAKTIYDLTDQVAEQLARSRKTLIVDEMDHLVDKNAVEVIRDIYEGSGAPILLIGEERLPAKLEQWERFHGRVLDWIGAQPASQEDAAHLRTLYCDRVGVADDLLESIREVSKGSVRRICVNLERVQEYALQQGQTEIDLSGWGSMELFTGKPPGRRV